MKQRPIIFSTAMVQAILDGTKTQTRRILPHTTIINADPGRFKYHGMDEDGWACFEDLVERDPTPWLSIKCPYGQPGDLLYVRETWAKVGELFCYKADLDEQLPEPQTWKPSIYMPKAAARIWLEITDVRAQRLQDITEDDALAEGVDWFVPGGDWGQMNGRKVYKKYPHDFSKGVGFATAKNSFETLWQSINAKRAGWETNPWIWAVTSPRTSNPQTLEPSNTPQP